MGIDGNTVGSGEEALVYEWLGVEIRNI